jgi:hypothetical protein
MVVSELSISAREADIASSGVSWGAVIGGAFVIASISLLMLALGAGFGLSSVSPWSNVGLSASTAGWMAIIWLVFSQIVACSLGGYLAGRLRKWQAIHNDEVHFRDTANGFTAWAVALVITVAFLGAAASSMAGAMAASGQDRAGTTEATSQSGAAGTSYYVDRLFRSDRPSTDNDSQLRGEAGRVFARTLLPDAPSNGDTSYLAQLVAAKTGLSANDATKRVSDTLSEARQAEDNARKAVAHLLLWIFLALLTGAFCASYAATIGGRQRDGVKPI